jgi:hypothetical protein
MPKDLPDLTTHPERFSPLNALSQATRSRLHAAAEPAETAPEPATDIEREYLNNCQKLEQLLERKQRAAHETDDVVSLHQELCLIGSRIQRNPEDPSHEEDYLAVLRRVKESLWRKLEAEELKGEFQKLHFELLGLGHRLGFERPPISAAPTDPFQEPDMNDDMSLGEVERQIAELQAQIRSLHDHR